MLRQGLAAFIIALPAWAWAADLPAPAADANGNVPALPQPAAPAVTPPPLPQPQPAVVPPPLPTPTAAQYFVAQNGQPVGPLSIAQVGQLIKGGQLKPSDLVWKAGDPNWRAADTFAELKDALGTVPPPVPAEEQFKTFLVGTWTATWNVPATGATNTVTVRYTADGKYNGVLATQWQGQTVNQPVAGTWTVAALDKDRFTLTNNDATGAGAGGTGTFKVLDQDTVQDEATGTVSHRVAR
jgi:hypothetical protein